MTEPKNKGGRPPGIPNPNAGRKPEGWPDHLPTWEYRPA